VSFPRLTEIHPCYQVGFVRVGCAAGLLKRSIRRDLLRSRISASLRPLRGGFAVLERGPAVCFLRCNRRTNDERNEGNEMENALEVHSIYSEIFALDTAEKQREALTSWWAYLDASCSDEKPCIERIVMLEEQG
jgi:hypothetical protein